MCAYDIKRIGHIIPRVKIFDRRVRDYQIRLILLYLISADIISLNSCTVVWISR